MDSIYQTVQNQFDWIEIDDLYRMLKAKSVSADMRKLFIKTMVIKSIATYLAAKQIGETQYTMRIKGCCQMALFLGKSFGYYTNNEYKALSRILEK